MKRRYAIVTMRIPVRADYPWKAAQPDLAQAITDTLCDGIRWLDATQEMAYPNLTVKIVEKEEP